MARGANRISILQSAGYVGGQKHGLWDFIYTTSTTKDPLYNIGDVVVIPSRGIFVYSKSADACISGQGAEFTYTGYIPYTEFTVTADVGDRSVTVPAATHAALATDELRNGFIWIYDGSTNNVQFRQILGNDSAAANAAFVVYLDGPLTEAVTTSSACEVCQNPYAALRTGTSASLPKAGVPTVKVTAANVYFWCQVGRLPSYAWLAPQYTIIDKQIGACWRHDGTLDTVGNGVDGENDYVSTQYAGHTIAGNYEGIGPLFQLA